MSSFNKQLFIANLRYLAKQRKIKLGDIERASGTCVGYISRLDKPGNPNNPSVEYVATAARMLGETIDDLMSKDFRDYKKPSDTVNMQEADTPSSTGDEPLTIGQLLYVIDRNGERNDRIEIMDENGEIESWFYSKSMVLDMIGNLPIDSLMAAGENTFRIWIKK